MTRKTKPRLPLEKTASDKIAIDPYRIYRITDLVQFANLFFPDKRADSLRAAFLAILVELKNSRFQNLTSQEMDKIPQIHDLPHPAMCKARAKMTRLGLIKKISDGKTTVAYELSNSFTYALTRLTEHIQTFTTPALQKYQQDLESQYIQIAKNEHINLKHKE